MFGLEPRPFRDDLTTSRCQHIIAGVRDLCDNNVEFQKAIGTGTNGKERLERDSRFLTVSSELFFLNDLAGQTCSTR